MRGALREAFSRSLLVAGSVLVATAALEGAFRLLRVRVGTVQINRATVRRSADPVLRFELRPGASVDAEVGYHVNALGFRGPDVDAAPRPGVTRIVLLGDSIAFGYWVAEQDAVGAQLARLLDETGPPGRRFEVVNLGVPGYNLEQSIHALRTRAPALAPDLVVLALCLNDLEDVFSYEYGLTADRAERRSTTFGRLGEALLERSRLFSWVEYRRAELSARRAFVEARNPLGNRLYEGGVQKQKETLLARFREMAAVLEPRGTPALVAVFPTFGNRFANYPHRKLHDAAVGAARESGLHAVDLLPCFAPYAFADVRVDVVHPSPLGHRVAAHGIRDALCPVLGACRPAPSACTGYDPRAFPRVRGY